MKISGASPIAKAVETARMYQVQGYSVTQPAPRDDFLRRFDSVSISGDKGRVSTAEMDLRGKLTQEVRTATPSGMITALREQIENGVYRPDPMEIARKMLLIGEAV